MRIIRPVALAICFAAGTAASQPPAEEEQTARAPFEDLTTPPVLYRNGWGFADAGYRCVARYETRGGPTVTIIVELGEQRASIKVTGTRLPRLESSLTSHPELAPRSEDARPPLQAELRPSLRGRRFPGSAILIDGQIASYELYVDDETRAWTFNGFRGQVIDLIEKGRAMQIYGRGRIVYSIPLEGSAEMARRLRRCLRDGRGYEG